MAVPTDPARPFTAAGEAVQKVRAADLAKGRLNYAGEKKCSSYACGWYILPPVRCR
jgi:hypothetical protein